MPSEIGMSHAPALQLQHWHANPHWSAVSGAHLLPSAPLHLNRADCITASYNVIVAYVASARCAEVLVMGDHFVHLHCGIWKNVLKLSIQRMFALSARACRAWC